MRRAVRAKNRYKLMSIPEMKNVLERLHVAFAHCSGYHLRILFKKRFLHRGFCAAAQEICSLCWYCKLGGRKMRRWFKFKDCEYDVKVVGNITDPSRKFVIRPNIPTTQDASQFGSLK
ncbi:hypothetical protein KIN20_025773 [Parelaphostrongylus tenuis]|uniref:Uncharacterized protein n=1 Tax=Parelaphostrongylus tenuis TaxID=148309 RepID=A0AAD5NC36_PARTN|nr:hypothetical protein KIN20_025773 [Parelaphostrongylus tenuis]